MRICYNSDMDVTYCLPQEAVRFRDEFPNLYYRICRLSDVLFAYFVCGDIHCIVGEHTVREGYPYFSRVSFMRKNALRYERRAESVLRGRMRESAIPKPTFPVLLEVTFSTGACEQFSFHFREYSDRSLLAFCGVVGERARLHFRRRFLRGEGKTASDRPDPKEE